ncbi:DNA repair protein RecO [uncultured Methylophaga sp.]|uniref:DNA repair protein RecO n=1 Tax=uncultured Methylophaga sp. TaxID=285271 RepID=UPI002631A8B4|nr:DNA repair protein RecO [uncultured Methylophaga sp.]
MELTAAFVLHHRPYRETSLLVDVLSRDYGRVSLVARGQRQSKKRKQSVMQPFQPLWLNWFGYGELVTLQQVEAAEAGYRLLGNASLCGLYLNELLVKLLPLHEAEPELFDSYRQTLRALQGQDDPQLILRLFEKQLLAQLGYGLQLDVDAGSGQPLNDALNYRYQPDSGPYQADAEATMTISGRSLRHLREEQGFDEQSLKQIKTLMRTVINYYLGGRPLHSRQLFAGLNQYKPKS